MPNSNYTGADYFTQVSIANGTTNSSKVRDHDIDNILLNKGALITSHGETNGLANITSIMPGTTGQVLAMSSDGMPVWAAASAVSGVNDGALELKVGTANPITIMTANQVGSTGLTIAAGATDGHLSINGEDLAIPGLDELAFTSITALTTTYNIATKDDIGNGGLDVEINGTVPVSNFWGANSTVTATLSFASGTTGAIAVNGQNIEIGGLETFATVSYVDASTTAVYNAATTYVDAATTNVYNAATTYVDQRLGDLGDVMTVVGTGATYAAYTNPVTGDVYIITSGDDAGSEYVYTGSAWELLGINEIDLSEYVKEEDLGALATLDSITIPANTFVTGLNASTTTETITPSVSASITGWNGGTLSYQTPTFQVNNGVLSLVANEGDVAYTAATFTSISATASPFTITHNAYTATMNSAVVLPTA